MAKDAPPSTYGNSFACPHCEAISHQYWYLGCARSLQRDLTPTKLMRIQVGRLESGGEVISSDVFYQRAYGTAKMRNNAKIFIEHDILALWKNQHGPYDIGGSIFQTNKIWISECHSCSRIALWIGHDIVYPPRGTAPKAHPDTPPDIKELYDEASGIYNQSPRGAAALIRVAVEKLCRDICINLKISGADKRPLGDLVNELKEKYRFDEEIIIMINNAKIIGNDAVHPNLFNIEDNTAMANLLFGTINGIVARTISYEEEKKRSEETMRIYRQNNPKDNN